MKQLGPVSIAIFVFLVDICIKVFMLGLESSRSIFFGFVSVNLQASLNQNLVFSIPAPAPIVYLIVLAVLAAMIKFFIEACRKRQKQAYPLALILGAASGNLFDRVFHGGVVDYMEVSLGGFSVSSFNLADVLILAGAIWWISLMNKRG